MAAGDLTVVGTMGANKITVADTVVVTNLNADKVDGADKDTDGTMAANSDAKVPSQKAAKTYVDTHAALQTAGIHGSASAATASKLVHRDASGRAKFAAPSASDDVAIKDTVDTHAALSAAGTHGSASAATASKLVHRDASGRAQFAAPSASADVAIKSTVDDLGATCVKLTGDQTVAGIKTFSSTIVGSISGNAGGNAATATKANGVVETGASATLKCKILEIGDWNMDATGSVALAHGLTKGKIREVSALIREDNDGTYFNFLTWGGNGGMAISDNNITLTRYTGSFFDSTTYDQTSYNRGWVTIWYEE